MLPEWIPPPSVPYEKMEKSPKNSVRAMEEGQKQADIKDFGATFLTALYSTHDWNDGISVENPDFATEDSTIFPGIKFPPNTRNEPSKYVERLLNKCTPIEWTKEYQVIDLESKIEAYNSTEKEEMQITLQEDGINFGGLIYVNISLRREIGIVEKVAPLPVYDTVKSTAQPTPTVKMTSLSLPTNTHKLIDIDSKTTARQMIMKVFKKFRMVDYPRNYALYEYVKEIDEIAGTLTSNWSPIPDDAYPLKVLFNWPIPSSGRVIVLREKEDPWYDSGEIPLREIFSMITGLKKEQVEVRNRKNPRTGLYEKTISKKVDRDPPAHQENRESMTSIEFVENTFLLIFTCLLTFMIGFFVGVCITGRDLERKFLERS